MVSGSFLYLVGALNLVTLRELIRARDTAERDAAAEQRRGFMWRILGSGLRRWIRHDWQMWPIGLLFGLGFDTASEIGLLGLTASASAKGHLPVGALLSLPLLFASGMCLLDTTDGVLMARAYAWALDKPAQRWSYNVITTGLSAAVALGVGTIELVGVLSHELGAHSRWAEVVQQVNDRFETLGSLIVAVFMALWGGAVLLSRRAGIRNRAAL